MNSEKLTWTYLTKNGYFYENRILIIEKNSLLKIIYEYWYREKNLKHQTLDKFLNSFKYSSENKLKHQVKNFDNIIVKFIQEKWIDGSVDSVFYFKKNNNKKNSDYIDNDDWFKSKNDFKSILKIIIEREIKRKLMSKNYFYKEFSNPQEFKNLITEIFQN